MVEAAASVNVLLPLPGDAITGAEKLVVTPVGAPLADNDIADLNPFTAAVAKVTGADPPGETLALVALGVSVKEPDDSTVRLSVCTLLALPPTDPSVRL